MNFKLPPLADLQPNKLKRSSQEYVFILHKGAAYCAQDKKTMPHLFALVDMYCTCTYPIHYTMCTCMLKCNTLYFSRLDQIDLLHTL